MTIDRKGYCFLEKINTFILFVHESIDGGGS